MKKFIYSLGVAVSLLLMPACGNMSTQALLSAGAKATQAMSLSDEQIQEYVGQYVAQMDKQNNVLPANNAYSQRLAKITNGLTSVDGIPLNFRVYQTNQVNAFACADGSVRVYTGLMDIMTDNEVLGVVGHEIGHVAHKDSKNAFKQALMNSALRDVLSSSGGLVGTLSQSQLGDIGESLLTAKFSRKQESNADDYAYKFLKSHGKNPWALVQSFEKLQQIEQSSGAQSTAMNQLFSSHPDIEKRISTMEARCKKEGIAKPDNK